MYLGPCPHPSTSPACMAGAARYVEREYGETGYSIALEASGMGPGPAVFRVRHFDGSEFRVICDRYENAATLPDMPDLCEAVTAYRAGKVDA